jgi:hypothetical protein
VSTVLDAVATATAAVSRLYPLGSVPVTPTYPYGVYSGAMGRGDGYSLDATYGLRSGRVVVQTFGKTAAAAEDWMDRVTAALLDQTLTIAGYDASPCLLELDPVATRDPDDTGVIGMTASFTFTATKEA